MRCFILWIHYKRMYSKDTDTWICLVCFTTAFTGFVQSDDWPDEAITGQPSSGTQSGMFYFPRGDDLFTSNYTLDLGYSEAPELVEYPGACVISGYMDVPTNWYGYLTRVKLRTKAAKFYYHVVYPDHQCCLKILFYLDDQLDELRAYMSCLQKEAIVGHMRDHVIELSPEAQFSGCHRNRTERGTRVIECQSGRIFNANRIRTWHIAACNCRSPTGLRFRYRFTMFGHMGPCPTFGMRSKAGHLASPYYIHICFGFVTLLNSIHSFFSVGWPS